MAITVDWLNKIINVPKADTQLVQLMPTEIRQLDLDSFRLRLRDLEDDVEGMIYQVTHEHNTTVDIGGVTLARVIRIINDYTVTFEDGQYAVNLVGANSNVGDVANVNQVSIRSANSAGLTSSKQVEDSAFEDGRVWINTNTGRSGQQYPRGTIGDPVDNLVDAQAIIEQRDRPKRIHITGALNVSSISDISDYDFLGQSAVLSSLVVATGANTTNLVVQDCEITGDLNGNVTGRRATSFTNLQDFDGTLHGTGLGGTITLALGVSAHEFIDCYSGEGGTVAPVVDCQDIVDPEIYFRRYSGSVEIRNFSSGNMTVGFTEGKVILGPTCTGGVIVVRGNCEAEGVSEARAAGCTVITTGTVREITGWQGRLAVNSNGTIVGIK